MIKRKTAVMIMAFILVLMSISAFSAPEESKKTIIVSVDSLDFETAKQMGDNYSTGLISLKSGSSSQESQFMTMATGRRVEVEEGSFKGLERERESLKVVDYSDILSQIDREYEDFSGKMDFLGESLGENGLETSYMGNREDVLMIADKTGRVDYGEMEIEYSEDYLKEKIDLMVENSDLLLLSYDIDDRDERLKLLSSLLADRTEDIVIIPRSIEGDIDYRLNSTIAPILYRDSDEPGIITSDSTKRRGLVSNTDIMVDILDKYGIEQEFAIGNRVETEPYNGDRVEAVKEIMTGFLNLDISKYIFRGIVILMQLISAMQLSRGKRVNRAIILMAPVLIMVTLISGMTPLSKYLIPYVVTMVGISAIVSIYIGKKAPSPKTADILAVSTNIFILVFLLVDFEVLYNSFVGYNSIVAALRFYGFNNDIMGVFLGTGIIAYFGASSRVRKRHRPILTAYTALLVLSHTKSFGSNFGGLMTATFMMGALIYYEYFYGKQRKWHFLVLALALFAAVGAIVYMGVEGSHMGEFFIRVREYGYMEFWDMICKKIKQVVVVLLLPPVGITMIVQSAFFFKYVRAYTEKGTKEHLKYIICYATAALATVLNDTGALAFIYIMVYASSKMMLEIAERNDIKE
jgi:hypothetical protein